MEKILPKIVRFSRFQIGSRISQRIHSGVRGKFSLFLEISDKTMSDKTMSDKKMSDKKMCLTTKMSDKKMSGQKMWDKKWGWKRKWKRWRRRSLRWRIVRIVQESKIRGENSILPFLGLQEDFYRDWKSQNSYENSCKPLISNF